MRMSASSFSGTGSATDFCDRNLLQQSQVLTPLDRHANHDRITGPPFEDLPHLMSAQCGDHVQHGVGVDPVLGQRLGLGCDRQRGQIGLVVSLDIDGTRDLRNTASISLPLLPSISKSSPYSSTATSAFTPATNSSTRISIG